MNFYFRALAIIAFLSSLFTLFSIAIVLLLGPTVHPILKLIALTIINLAIFWLATKQRISAFVAGFILSLFGLVHAYLNGVVYDIFTFHASPLTYIGFALTALMLGFSAFGLLFYFKSSK